MTKWKVVRITEKQYLEILKNAEYQNTFSNALEKTLNSYREKIKELQGNVTV